MPQQQQQPLPNPPIQRMPEQQNMGMQINPRDPNLVELKDVASELRGFVGDLQREQLAGIDTSISNNVGDEAMLTSLGQKRSFVQANIDHDLFTGGCTRMQEEAMNYFSGQGIESHPITLNLPNGSPWHEAVVVKMTDAASNPRLYLFDPSIKQFSPPTEEIFRLQHGSKAIASGILTREELPGFRLSQDPASQAWHNALLRDGVVPLDEKVAQQYLAAFNDPAASQGPAAALDRLAPGSSMLTAEIPQPSILPGNSLSTVGAGAVVDDMAVMNKAAGRLGTWGTAALVVGDAGWKTYQAYQQGNGLGDSLVIGAQGTGRDALHVGSSMIGLDRFQNQEYAQGGVTLAATAAPFVAGAVGLGAAPVTVVALGAASTAVVVNNQIDLFLQLMRADQSTPSATARVTGVASNLPGDLHNPYLDQIKYLEGLKAECLRTGKPPTVTYAVNAGNGSDIASTITVIDSGRPAGEYIPPTGVNADIMFPTAYQTTPIDDLIRTNASAYLGSFKDQSQGLSALQQLIQVKALGTMLPGKGANLNNPYLNQMDALKQKIQNERDPAAKKTESGQLDQLAQFYLTHGGKLEYAQAGVDQYKATAALEAMLPGKDVKITDPTLRRLETLKENIQNKVGDIGAEQAQLDAGALDYLKHLDPNMATALGKAKDAIDGFKQHQVKGGQDQVPAGAMTNTHNGKPPQQITR